MAAGATHALSFRLPARRSEPLARRRDRLFETWRAAIWTSAVVGTATLATTALNAVPGSPVDEIVMASAYTLTGVLGHLAPIPDN
ncbi:MAG: hypothetical protein ACRDLQ_03235 [Solirubrobacterales bacterium]